MIGHRSALPSKRALVAGFLSLWAALSPPPAPTMPDQEDDWSKAIQAARADRAEADPKGTYFGVFVKKLAQIQGPALRACRAQYPASASASLQALALLSEDGTIQQLLMKPSSEFHDCVKNKIRASTLPKPPKAPYWIFWGNLAAPPGGR